MTNGKKVTAAAGSVLLIGFIVLYLYRVLKTYDILAVHPLVWVPFICVIGFAVAGFRLQKYKKTYMVLSFIVLFLLYSVRVLTDNFASYLWCEDGLALINDAIYRGPASLFDAPRGTIWFIPRLIGFVSYHICRMLKDITYLPQLMSLITKVVATGGFMYFMSDRFGWIVKDRAWRFIICAMTVLAIPTEAYETVPCDTSIPFILNFTVFLIGLDTLFGPVRRPVGIGEAVFLTLQSLSTAAAPFCGAVAVFACARWLFVKPEKERAAKCVVKGIVCTLMVVAGTIYQMITFITGPRDASSLSLGKRLFVCAKDFVFFPYLDSYRNVLLWIIGLGGWVLIILLAKLSWKMIAYCAVYGYAFLFYCSMTDSADAITKVISSGIGSRYYLMNYLIAFFLLGVGIYRLFTIDKIRKCDGALLLLSMLLISVPTYIIDIAGLETAFTYDYCSGLYDPEGGCRYVVSIAPDPLYRVVFPGNLPGHESSGSEAQGFVETVNGQSINDTVVVEADLTDVEITGWAADENGEPFEYIFFDWGEGQWASPVSIDSEEYVFFVDTTFIRENRVSFIGITSDGERYVWSADVDAVVQ